jgi:hypothetical protein
MENPPSDLFTRKGARLLPRPFKTKTICFQKLFPTSSGAHEHSAVHVQDVSGNVAGCL